MDSDRIVDVIIIVIILAILGLKIAGIITWTWLQMLMPIIYLLGIGIVFAAIILIIGLIIINKKEN